MLKQLVHVFCVSHVSSEGTKPFSSQDRLYFLCRACKLPKDQWLSFLLFQISFLYHLSWGVRGDCTSPTDVSFLGQGSALLPTFFKCQAHQHAFLQCYWWAVISPSPGEWVADTGAVGSIFSLDQCLSLSGCGQNLLLPKGVQETLPWLVTGFCSLRSRFFWGPLEICIYCWLRGGTPTISHIRIICTLVC